MLDLLKDIGGWSVLDKSFKLSKWDFQSTLEKLQNNYSLGGLFFWVVAEDDKNSSGYIIQVSGNLCKKKKKKTSSTLLLFQIDQPALTLPSSESYYNITNNTKLFSAYLDYMTTVPHH